MHGTVVPSQPINAAAFVVDGMLFGASDFLACALIVLASALPALGLMRAAPSRGPAGGLLAVWAGLAVFMLGRAALGAVRVAAGGGPWAALRAARAAAPSEPHAQTACASRDQGWTDPNDPTES